MTSLILVSGHPGMGKSTLAKKLVEEFKLVWLDIDPIAEVFSPGNRDKDYCRDLEPKILQALFNQAERNFEANQNVLIDFPWTHLLLEHPELTEKIKTLVKKCDVQLLVLECVLPDEATWKKRIISRREERDKIKWESDEAWARFVKDMHYGERNPLPHFEINCINPAEHCLAQAKSYLAEKLYEASFASRANENSFFSAPAAEKMREATEQQINNETYCLWNPLAAAFGKR